MDLETVEALVDTAERDRRDEILRVYAEWQRAREEVDADYGAIIARLTGKPSWAASA